MRFFSFVRDGLSLIPVEVEVNLIPGLPDIKFSGLVDGSIRESTMRIKSAFAKQGFKWPTRQQIIINLSPSYIKKHSFGMDLALASALLWRTSQVNFSTYKSDKIYTYGELNLKGEIRAPEDWDRLPLKEESILITGFTKNKNYRKNNYLVKNLKNLNQPLKMPVEAWQNQLQKPQMPKLSFSQATSLLLKIVATGEHNLLLCGEAGSGKTTLAENLYYLLDSPNKKLWEQNRQLFQGEKLAWRPYINPHHTTTPLAMIGGGVPVFPGEISKAHGGLLVLDEYLEFHPKVQEALREPVEKKQIRLVRRGQSLVLPSHFLLVATSNLCPCGDYVPNKSNPCAYSLKRCQSHLDKLSGPMLDRFEILAFSNQWKGERSVSLKSVAQEVEEAKEFRIHKRNQKKLNSELDYAELESFLSPQLLKNLPEASSYRRKKALLSVARTLSDLKKEQAIGSDSLEEAFKLTVKNFYFLKNRMLIR